MYIIWLVMAIPMLNDPLVYAGGDCIQGEQMTQQGPDPLRRYRWLEAVWVPASVFDIVIAAALDQRALFVTQTALVSWFVWFTTGRHPGSERLTVHVLFCLFVLAIAAVFIFLTLFMLTTDDLPSVPVPTPVIAPR